MSQHRAPETTTTDYHRAVILLDALGPDPDAARHVADLLEAIGARCIYAGCDKADRAGRMCDTHYRQHSRMLRTIRANQTETLNRKAAA